MWRWLAVSQFAPSDWPARYRHIFPVVEKITTYNLARMNMLVHGVKDSEFEIFHGDTLLNEWEMLREANPASSTL